MIRVSFIQVVSAEHKQYEEDEGHSLHLSNSLNARATILISVGNRILPHQLRPPERVPLETKRICTLVEAQEKCGTTGHATASQLVRPPEKLNLAGKDVEKKVLYAIM